MTEAEREQMSELRMRISVAQAGESLSELGRRVANEWNPNETAVANGLHIAQPLAAGQLVKIVRREPFPPEDLEDRDLQVPADDLATRRGSSAPGGSARPGEGD
jgi:hypothetical protein